MVFIHLKDKKLSYLQHMKQALSVSCNMLYASAACFIHAFYPDVCQDTASNIARKVVNYVDHEDKVNQVNKVAINIENTK